MASGVTKWLLHKFTDIGRSRINKHIKPSRTEYLQERAVLLYDCTKGQPIYQENPHLQVPVYSIAKIMTAIVVIENVPDPEKTFLTITPKCIKGIEWNVTSLAGFQKRLYKRHSVMDLLYGCLVSSGCEATQQLAYYVGRGSISEFMTLVNNKLLQLGCLETNFIDPTGRSDKNRATAADICTIFKYAMDNPLFRKIVSTGFYRFAGFQKANWSTNKLINPRYWQDAFYPYAVGGKTGSAPVSGGYTTSFACLFSRNGKEYIGIILNDYSADAEFTGIEPMYPMMISLLERQFAKQPYMRIQFAEHYIASEVGSEYTLKPKIVFNNGKQSPTFRWYSTDKTVAEVSAAGEVKVLSPGLAQIIVMSQTGDYDFCQVNSTGCDEITMHRPGMDLLSC